MSRNVGDYTIDQISRLICGQPIRQYEYAMPVETVPGDAFPSVEGEGYYHTTMSGKTRVINPGAYGWRTMYHPSTRRIEVGADWQSGEWRRDERHGVKAALLCGARVTRHGVRAQLGIMHDSRLIWMVSHGSWSYHATRTVSLAKTGALVGPLSSAATEDALRAIREALRARHSQERLLSAACGKRLTAIWVDEAASARSGNCAAGTAYVADAIRKLLPGIGAVRADVLIDYRDDSFTRRAVMAAAGRG